MIFEKLPKAQPNDREHLFAVADCMTKLSKKARREGILAFEEWIDDDDFLPPSCGKLEDFLFRQIMRMMVDGCDAELIVEFSKNYVSSIDESEPALLALMLGVRAVLAIQEGYNPRVLVMMLASMMGHPLCEAYIETRLTEDL